MVLLAQMQVSDSDIRAFVKKEAYKNKVIHKLTSLLDEGEDYGYRPPSQMVQSRASRPSGCAGRNGSRVSEDGLPRLSRPSIRAGLIPAQLQRCSTIAASSGKRHTGATDPLIDVTVYFPYTGDSIKMTVDRDLPLGVPKTPGYIRDDRFLQYWGRNANELGYTARREADRTRQLPKSLKGEISKITGFAKEHMRVVHPQSKCVFRGSDSLNQYGFSHGQTVTLLHLPFSGIAREPDAKKRFQNAKYLPTLSHSQKKQKAPSVLRQSAVEQTFENPYRIMPRWEMNAQGLRMSDLKFSASADLGDQTIYFKDYNWMSDRGVGMDAVSGIRERMEKNREYMNKKQISISSPAKLRTALRVITGKKVTTNEAFRAWKEYHLQRLCCRQEFGRDLKKE